MGKIDPQNNVLKNAPHTAEALITTEWKHSYSREQAAYPAWTREHKFWPVGRIDNAFETVILSAPVYRWKRMQ